jgi:hypothetical protein
LDFNLYLTPLQERGGVHKGGVRERGRRERDTLKHMEKLIDRREREREGE